MPYKFTNGMPQTGGVPGMNQIAPQQQGGGIFGSYAPQAGGIFAALKDFADTVRGSGNADSFANYQAMNQQNQMRQQLLQGLNSEDPAARQQAYQTAALLGINAKPFQDQQASAALPKLLQSMQPRTENVAQTAPVSLPNLPGQSVQGGGFSFEAPGLGLNDALANSGSPELQAQYAPELIKNLMAGPKFEKLGNDLLELPTLPGGTPRIAMSGPLEAPKTRTVRIGSQEVTQEFDNKTGKWQEVGRGAAFKPDSASESSNGVVVMPGGNLVDRRTGKPLYTAPAKKLPASVQNAESDDISAIQTSRAISKDLGVIKDQITTGKLTLSPFANIAGSAMNYAGMGNDNSHRLSTFKSTLEKLRNDSLRLNKGVQTEGDAQRAWNELFNNLNDQKLVQERLSEIQSINDRAANLHAQQIDLRRRNFDYPDFDPRQIDPKPALGGPGSTGNPSGAPAANSGWTVKRR